MAEFIRALVGSFLPCAAFAVILNARGSQFWVSSAGAALCWLSYLFFFNIMGTGVYTANFLATVAVSLFSEIMARVCKTPVTVFLLVGLLPLVPGGGIYYTMEHALAGDTTAFLSQLMSTFGIAASLALGVLVVSSVTRFAAQVRHH